MLKLSKIMIFLRRYYSKSVLCSLLFWACFTIVQSQVVVPFNLLYQKVQRGGIVFLSNVGIVPDSPDTLAMPPSDGSINDLIKSRYVDIDGSSTTYMSSSDSLNLPDCSAVTFAGLFWGGCAKDGTKGWDERTNVKIKANKNSYVLLSADSSGYYNDGYYNSYYCYKNITTLVRSYGSNTRWTVADLVGDTTMENRFSGWNLVIVYKNEAENLRQLSVYRGFAYIRSGGGNLDIAVQNFLTPNSGDVSFELGAFTFEGDRGWTGDQLLVKGGENSDFINISDGINLYNNVFNSTISRKGTLTPFRNPNYNDNFSLDADIFSPDNSSYQYIPNSASSMTIRVTSTMDAYFPQVVTLAMDVKNPDNRLGMRVRDINGGVAYPGDTLEYTLLACNVGTDVSVNTYISDQLEANAVYVPGSMKVVSGNNMGALSDEKNDDAGDYDTETRMVTIRIGDSPTAKYGGALNNDVTASDSIVVSFRVTTTDNCTDLLCDNIINNHAYIYGWGMNSGLKTVSDQVPEYFDSNTCTINEISNKNTIIIFSNCDSLSLDSNSPVCYGSSLCLIAPDAANASYSWSGPNNFTSSQKDPVIEQVTGAQAGTYSCEITLNSGCVYELSTTVIVSARQETVPNAGNDQYTCDLTANLSGNEPSSGQSGLWSFISGPSSPVIVSPNVAKTQVTFNQKGSYVFTWNIIFSYCNTIPDTVIVVVGSVCSPVLDNEWYSTNKETPVSGTILNNDDIASGGGELVVQISPISGPQNGAISIDTNGVFLYTPNADFIGSDTVVFRVTESGTSAYGYDTLFVYVLPVLDDLFIPEGFSPNGDGVNDKFVIRGIENYPLNKVIIFSRWGNKVFEAKPYENTWDGTNAYQGLGGHKLPVGTYFYVLDLGIGTKLIKGFIYLNR